MAGINTGRVVAGGLVAGVVLNALDFVNNAFVLAGDFEANMLRLGLDPAAMESGAGIATWVVIDFLLGLVVVWTYAAIRARFGAGPKTAVYAGLVPYVAITSIMFGLSTGGLIAPALFWKLAGLQLISIMAGTLAGAAVYREDG